MTDQEPRRMWRLVGVYFSETGEKRYIFDNFAPVGPHKYLAPFKWFWGHR